MQESQKIDNLSHKQYEKAISNRHSVSCYCY